MKEKSIVAGILAICPETERFLLLKRAENIRFPLYWNLPGGSFDEGDGYPKKTAIREFREETGYNSILKISKKPLFVDKNNHMDFYTYVGIFPEEFVPDLSAHCSSELENVDYRWAPLSCDFGDDEKIVPNILNVLKLKKDTIKKIIKKFKNKNYE